MSKFLKGASRLVACALAAVLSAGTFVAGAVTSPTLAFAGEKEVRAVGDGVFKFNMGLDYVFTDDDGHPLRYADGSEVNMQLTGRGSAFLINEDTVLTCYHCAAFGEPFYKYMLDAYGIREQEILDSIKYSVTVSRDVTVDAELVNWSKAEDWAIFKLSQSVGGTSALKLRNSTTVDSAEVVWTVGFPADSDVQVINTYRPDDVTIKDGKTNKAQGIMQLGAFDGMLGFDEQGKLIPSYFDFSGNFLQTSVPISGGDSGGPMVDNDGNVIGIAESSDGSYYYAVAIDEVMTALDRLNIKYEVAPGPRPVKDLNMTALNAAIADASAKSAIEFTPESFAELTKALTAAQDAAKLTLTNSGDADELAEKQAQIDAATTALKQATNGLKPAEGSDSGSGDASSASAPSDSTSAATSEASVAGLSLPIIIGIAIAAVAIIGAVVFILLSRKKKESVPGPGVDPGYQGGVQPAVRNVDVQDVDTTVMAEKRPDTSVLAGSLTRVRTGDRYDIVRSTQSFGRSRTKVDCILSGNTNISNVHLSIIVRGGQTYVKDENSANGTRVNGVLMRPGEEMPLKNGDTVTMADEDFRYTC